MLRTPFLASLAICIMVVKAGTDMDSEDFKFCFDEETGERFKVVCVDNAGYGYKTDEFVPTGDPCKCCQCDASGKIYCAKTGCRVPPCVRKYTLEGECCPVCSACVDKDGNGYHIDEDVPTGDPCTKCKCTANGLVLCSAQACALEGPCNKIFHPENVCCPICIKCVDKAGNVYQVGDDIPTGNPCEFCHCSDEGEIVCAVIDCAAPPCETYHVPKDKCCPVCRDCKAEDGTVYKADEIVPNKDPCLECRCYGNGKIKCDPKKCPRPPCKNPIQEKGKCCPICPTPDCKGVLCPIPKCPNSYVPDGKCCPECPDCSKVLCPLLKCATKPIWIPGKCCQECGPIDCFQVLCVEPKCPNAFLPEGECCPVCPDCSEVACPAIKCFIEIWTPGQCCPICGQPDCLGVLCPIPKCPNAFIPIGECCPVCPDCSKVPCILIKCEVEIWIPGQCCPQCGPTDCSTVKCSEVKCPNAYVPKGECCPICPDCSKVLCPAIKCINEIWLPGECCPRCGKPDCSTVLCAEAPCKDSFVPEGECCPICPIDCRLVKCGKPECENHYIPKGKCCPVCPDCSAVLCLLPKCQNAYVPKGQCCPVCPDCTKKLCPLIKCATKPVWLPGKCCQECQPNDCLSVKCDEVKCPNAYVPKGKCCPVCPDCSKTFCPAIACFNEIFLPGECCPRCGKPDKMCENGGIPLKDKVCGGFAGIRCPKGYKCDHSNNPKDVADLLGICCKVEICQDGRLPLEDEVCGGFAGFPCPGGYICDHSNNPPNVADFFGICCRDCSNVKCKQPECEDSFVPRGECCPICPGDVCDLPKVVGPCEALIPRYFFNKKTGKCEKFFYGGCDGNGNNFESLSDCLSTCLDVCELPKVSGPCLAYFPRYYFNSATQTCEQFIYGGCQGNENNFATIGECQAACLNVCELPKDPGPCKAFFPRYYFNSATQTCEQFIYGGCQGNQNNFVTIEECQTACPSGNVCELPKVIGPCRALIPRYYFNKKTGKCEKFNYGGCGANGNNFKTLSECQSTCLEDVCEQPKEIGPCDAVIPRYYFNKKTGQCEKFNFGGCGGNANNFETLAECQSECKEDVCEQPKLPGPCKGSFPRYYFNQVTGQCEKFIYGGCGGNENNFESLSECQSTCLEVCEQPKYPGPCKAYFPRFFFNSATQMCEPFVYGGCHANQNNFVTLEDCQEACPSVCELPKDPGPCRGSFPRYFYNSETKTCDKFTYGGCQGNANNFEKLEDCQETCNVTGCYDENGNFYEFGENVPSSDPCRSPCICTGSGKIICAIVDCGILDCEKPVNIDGQCCPVCPKKFCKHTNGKLYKIGSNVPSDDPCEKCKCEKGGVITCLTILCEKPCCPKPVKKPGKCCPVCPKVCKHKNGKLYKIGSNVPSDDPCQKCKCEKGGVINCVEILCEKLTCLNPIKKPGQCCPKCPKVCKHKNGKIYKIGSKVPSDDPCLICECAEGGEIICASMACVVPCENPIPVPGKCCPRCPKVCTDKDGQTYKFGQIVPTENPCTEQCRCTKEKGIVCDKIAIKCEKPTCENAVSVEGQCCPICPRKACRQPKRPGPCKGSFTRYFYNNDTKQCESFIYGGCLGNLNRFETLQECEDTCRRRKVCDLPKVAGPCKGSFYRYYYNKKTGKCESFVYGGCKGNRNNFMSLKRCKAKCMGM